MQNRLIFGLHTAEISSSNLDEPIEGDFPVSDLPPNKPFISSRVFSIQTVSQNHLCIVSRNSSVD